MKESIENLLEKEESPILEFKRDWYWDSSTPSSEMSDRWGELIKDIISLANGYMSYVGDHRYLIIGFSGSESRIYDVHVQDIKQLQNIKNLKKTIIEKLANYTRPSLMDINIELVDIDNHKILVFEIPSPTFLIELKSQLKTKTRHLDEGIVLVRKGQKMDQIGASTPDEIKMLTDEFQRYRESIPKVNSDNYTVPSFERTIERTVQLFIDKNSSYSLEFNYPIKEKDGSDGVFYEVYRLVDSFSGEREFIYIPENAAQAKTFGRIKSKNVVNDIEHSIVLTDKPRIKDGEKRKSNLKKFFKTKHIYFVEEFGYEYLYKDCIPRYERFNLPVYVDGLYDSQTDKDQSALEKLKCWFEADDQPLYVVSGHGGIGKTTLAKQFLDYVNSVTSDTGILFIDSKEIVNELSRSFSSTNKITDVFDFYKALVAADKIDVDSFDRDLLMLSMDNGSLIVVLDGIDEVIAKLGDKFDVEKFITSISREYSSDLHRTKVLITCRDHFWNEVGKKVTLPQITLKAFNEKLTSEFFSQKFKGDLKKIKKAMKLAEDLAIESNESAHSEFSRNFIPFLLDMIGYLINSNGAEVVQNVLIESRYLSADHHTDVLVAQICRREMVKLDSLNVDQQIQLFIQMASRKQNSISVYDIKSELLKLVNEVDDSLIEKIKGHPLVQCDNNTINFRYDVFDTYFKSLLVVDLFKRADISSFDENCARIISGYVKFDSSFVKSVSQKLVLDNDGKFVLFCIELIECANEITSINRESFVSAIVSLLLTLLQSTPGMQSNITTRSKLVTDIFGVNNEIRGLCLVDIFGYSNPKPTFDFKGKELNDCVFDNYEYFCECEFDDVSRLNACRLKGIDPRDGVRIKLPENLFSSSCDVTHILHLITKKNAVLDSTRSVIRADLERVFKLFYERGNFYPKKQEEVRKKLSAVKLLPDLISRRVIVNFKDPRKPTMKQYKIDPAFNSVISFIEQGTPSAELEELISYLERSYFL